MIIQHPNGNSYLFIDNRVFVSAYNEKTKSVITVELDLSLPLNDWEKEQISKLPNHECNNPSCYNHDVPFGELYCNSCNAHFEMMDKMYENQF